MTSRIQQAYRHIQEFEKLIDNRYAPRELTQEGIAQGLGTTRATASAVVGDMVQRGLAVKMMRYVNDTSDKQRRLRQVYHTVNGKTGTSLVGGAVYVPVGKMAQLEQALKVVAQILKDCHVPEFPDIGPAGPVGGPQNGAPLKRPKDNPRRPEQGAD
jgi:hypothetical protein